MTTITELPAISDAKSSFITKHDLYMVYVITRREVKDAFRDWRIIIPIILLTIAFPTIMNFTCEHGPG